MLYVPLWWLVNFKCKLLQPVVAFSKNNRTTVTLPVGAVLEIHVGIRHLALAGVVWEGQDFSAFLTDLQGACTLDDIRKFS